MYPLSIGMVIETKQLGDEIRPIMESLPVRIVFEESAVTDWAEFQGKLQRLRPHVLLLEITKAGDRMEEQIRQIRSLVGAPAVFAVDLTANPETILRAIRAGATEFLYPPLANPLRAALEKLSEQKNNEPQVGLGRAAAFVSVKGGCGATTLACHTAVEIPALTNQKVLLADLDLQSGLISLLMRSTTPYTLLDAVQNLHRLDPSFWKALVSNGRPGVEVVGSVPTPNFQETPSSNQLRDVLRFLRTQYAAVLLDLGRSVTPVLMSTVEHVDMTFLVATLEMPALQCAQHMLRTLLNSGCPKDRLRVILNRMPKNPDITIPELEKMLGAPIFMSIPNDYPALYECYAEGKLLPASNRLSKRCADLAVHILGMPASVTRKKFALFG